MNIKSNFLIFSISTCFPVPALSYAEGWTFQIEPYVMFSSIEGNASIGRISGVPVDVSFGDILENLDLGGMVHFEAHHENGWGVSLDYGFMKLGSEITGTRGGVTDVGVRQGILEALAVRRQKLPTGHLDILFGIRWWDNDLDVTVDPAFLPGPLTTGIEEDWIDLVIGARWLNNISDNWKFLLRGDIGGLGLESDFTLNLAAGVQYQMSDNWVLDMQYRAIWLNYQNDKTPGQPGHYAYDVVTHGPMVGFIFKF